MYELHGHRSKVSYSQCIEHLTYHLQIVSYLTVHLQVTSLVYSAQHQRALSVGEDSRLVCWHMGTHRVETPDWAESDICQLCSR